jgi:Tfp pilus assembly PilM family ATPase
VQKERIHVEDFRQVPLPDGAMINGIITDVGIMTDFLDTIAKEYGIYNETVTDNPVLNNKTSIVVQASNIQTKIIEVPPVDERQVREFIRREFTQYENIDEQPSDLFDYTILNNIGPDGGVEILAASAGREMIEDYRNALVGANYNVDQIGIGIEALIKLVSLIPELLGKTYLLVQTEHSRQTITMFLDGTFRIFNGYRLTSEYGTDAWVSEIGHNLSSMLQFNRAQRGQSELSVAYFAGLSPLHLQKIATDFAYLNVAIEHFNLTGAITVSPQITVERAFDPGQFLFNLGALVKR